MAEYPICRAKDFFKELCLRVGENPQREGLRETPRRIAGAWTKLYEGYGQDPAAILKSATFMSESDHMIVLRDIEFFSTCEHHLLPFYGKAHVGYIPTDQMVGVSKIARALDALARRMQVQERLTAQLAEAIHDAIEPKGVMVVIDAVHLCTRARGVEKQNSIMTTSEVSGVFRSSGEARAEFMGLIRNG
jgi:GTP cyclohydrolase IA